MATSKPRARRVSAPSRSPAATHARTEGWRRVGTRTPGRRLSERGRFLSRFRSLHDRVPGSGRENGFVDDALVHGLHLIGAGVPGQMEAHARRDE
jgi:hypothetical protein